MQSYGAERYAHAFQTGGKNVFPRREERMTNFMTHYINSLGLSVGKSAATTKVLNSPQRPSKNRVVIIFGDGDKNV